MSDAGKGWKVFIATGLGTGLLRPAPGSWGSLAACLACAGALAAGGAVAMNAAAAAIVVLASVACVALGPFAERTFGKKDPGQCTLDEWAGQALTLVALPLGAHWPGRLLTLGAAFFVFRLIDSIKPPPIRRLERLNHGWGVLMDDLLAGAESNVICQLLLRLWLMPALGIGA